MFEVFNKIFPKSVNSPTPNQISFLAHVLKFQKNLPDKNKFLYLKPFFSISLVWSEEEVSVFYSLPVFQFIPNFFQIYFQFASNSPCFQFLSHVAAISSEMNSCKKSVSFNFKKYVKFFWKRQLSFGLGINFCLLLRWSHMLVESE